MLLDNSSLIISIHAPTRGATECVHTRTKCHHISIHAPTRGATVPPLNHHLLYQRFQSTLLQEERPCTGRICLDNRLFQSTLLQEERLSSIKMEKSHIISIHAPTRGATDKAVEGILNILNFNPRSYKRSDINRHTRCLWRINFNPRSYKRSDHTARFRRCDLQNFNPRSYKRSDLDHLHHGCFHLLFQSTLLQEERRVILTPFTFDLVLISIHAPTRGATSDSE